MFWSYRKKNIWLEEIFKQNACLRVITVYLSILSDQNKTSHLKRRLLLRVHVFCYG